MGLTPSARDLVARTIIGEAARGDRDSMISVAHVLKNRADSGQYGDPFNGGLTNTVKAPKQFSIWNSDIASSGKTISPNDPYYQRAAAIADSVFSGQTPDNTGGADHYYAPGGMAGGRAPSWAIGQTPTATIGGQHFYKLGLSASDATNFGHTSAPAIEVMRRPLPFDATCRAGLIPFDAATVAPAPPLAAMPDAAKPAAVNAISTALADAKSMLGKNEVPNHDEIMSYLHDGGQDLDPHKLAWCASFVSASLQKAGLPVPTQVAKGSLQSGGANANNYLTYGSAVTDPNGVQAGDILVAKDGSHVGFAEGPVRQGPNGPEVQLLAGNEKDMSGRYAPGSYTNPETGAVANRAQVGMVGERWVPLANYAVRRAPDAVPASPPVAGTTPAAASYPGVQPVANSASVPAANAQPVSATAPGSSGGNFAAPPGSSAGFVGPGSDKYSVISGMTTGTSHNPQLITAANWGNLFGGGAPSAPPAAAPAAASAPSPQPASAPAAAPKPLDTSYGPQQPPPTVPPGAPVGQPPGSPLSSIVPSWGASTPSDPATYPEAAPPAMPGANVSGMPAMNRGGPSMGFPAMTNPFGQPPPNQQLSQLPGSMFASAQNLMKFLFPTATG